jgi:hypothetical protein
MYNLLKFCTFYYRGATREHLQSLSLKFEKQNIMWLSKNIIKSWLIGQAARFAEVHHFESVLRVQK